MRNFKLTLLIAAALQLGAASVAKAETTLTMSSWLPPKHVIVSEMMVPWAEAVEKATEGRVKIKVLPKALGKPPAHFDIAREGTADLSYGIHGYQPGRFVLNSVVEFPFLGNDGEAISTAYWRVYEKHLAKADEHKGVKVLGLFTHGPGQIMNTKKPINSIADLKDMKMRIGGGNIKEISSNFGIAQMFMPAPEVYEALSRGVADGVFFPLEAIDGFKLEKIMKHVTTIEGGLYNTSFFFVMNGAKWESLSDEDKAAIDSVSGEAFAQMAGKAFQLRDIAGMEKFKANGGEVVVASPEMLAEIEGHTAKVADGWIARANELGVDGEAALADLRAEIKALQGN